MEFSYYFGDHIISLLNRSLVLNIQNCMPISLLSILEKIMKNRYLTFLEMHNTSTDFQHGFRKKIIW